MKKLTLLALVSVVSSLIALAGCSHGGKMKLNSSENKVVKGGVVSLSASEIKIRKNKFDLSFVIGNESGKNIVIVLEDLQCFKGAKAGSLNDGLSGLGMKEVGFHAGENKTFRLVCTLAAITEGNPRVLVKKVYANPNGDGFTTGAVLVRNAEWALADATKPAATGDASKADVEKADDGEDAPVKFEVIKEEPVKAKKKK